MSEQTTTLQESLTATLLKSVLPNSLLKEIMTDALVYRSGGDFDTYLTPGHVYVNEEYWKNFPPGAYKYGVLIAFGHKGSFFAQHYVPHNMAHLYWRIYYTKWGQQTGTWSSWYMVTPQLAS